MLPNRVSRFVHRPVLHIFRLNLNLQQVYNELSPHCLIGALRGLLAKEEFALFMKDLLQNTGISKYNEKAGISTASSSSKSSGGCLKKSGTCSLSCFRALTSNLGAEPVLSLMQPKIPTYSWRRSLLYSLHGISSNTVGGSLDLLLNNFVCKSQI